MIGSLVQSTRRALSLPSCRGGSEHPGAKTNPGALFRVPLVAAAGHPLSAAALGGKYVNPSM